MPPWCAIAAAGHGPSGIAQSISFAVWKHDLKYVNITRKASVAFGLLAAQREVY
jgi:hypothetical protein